MIRGIVSHTSNPRPPKKSRKRNDKGVLSQVHDGLICVQIGRPVVFSLAAEGEAGVRKVLQMLRDEFELTMALSGCRSLQEITRDHIMTDWDAPRYPHFAPRL